MSRFDDIYAPLAPEQASPETRTDTSFNYRMERAMGRKISEHDYAREQVENDIHYQFLDDKGRLNHWFKGQLPRFKEQTKELEAIRQKDKNFGHVGSDPSNVVGLLNGNVEDLYAGKSESEILELNETLSKTPAMRTLNENLKAEGLRARIEYCPTYPKGSEPPGPKRTSHHPCVVLESI